MDLDGVSECKSGFFPVQFIYSQRRFYDDNYYKSKALDYRPVTIVNWVQK